MHPTRRHTVAELLAEYLQKVTPCKSMHSQRRDRMVLAAFHHTLGNASVGRGQQQAD